MSKKNQDKAKFPMFFGMGMWPMPNKPAMPPMPFGERAKDNAGIEDAKANMKKFWEQMIEMQKTSIDSSRELWDQYFEHMMDMEDLLTDSMPDEAPSVPGFIFGQWIAVSPKELMKQLKEFQEMAKDHIAEQADSVADFSVRGQEKLCDIVCKPSDSAKEEKDEPAQTDGQPAEQQQ